MHFKILNYIFAGIVIAIILCFIILCIRKFILKKQTHRNKETKLSNNKLKTFFQKNWYYIAFAILLIIAIFTRTYKINSLLNGLHVDEAGMAYDAYCIANYGVDRYLNSFPIYMINFGGGQSALYTYLATIIVKFFDLSFLSIRLRGIILSLTAIITGFVLIKKTHGIKSGLFFMFLMIICPWHVMQSRFGLDCNLLSSMLMFSITGLVVSKKWWHYIITGILFGLSLYTYVLSYIIIPVLLLLSIIYMLYIKKIKFKNVVILGIPIAILAVPLILMLLINMGYLEQINCIITIPKLFSFRAEELTFNNIGYNLSLFKNIITYGGFIYNSIPQFGTIYLFAIPLVICGIILGIIDTFKSIKNKKFNITAIMLFLFIANILVMALTSVNVNKLNSIYISLLYFIFIFVKKIYNNFKVGFFIILIMYIVMATSFFYYYYNKYNVDNKVIDLVNNDAILATQRVEEIDKNKNVYMHLNTHEPWIYVLYAIQMSPYEFNKTKVEDLIDDWNNKFYFGKYRFELPEKIVSNSIYVIEPDEKNQNFVDELINSNYKSESCGRYTIFY